MADEPKSKPDYHLRAQPKSGEAYAIVGAAWKMTSEYGEGVNIRLHPGVRLAWDDELWLTLWETKRK